MAIQPIEGSITVEYEEIDGSPTESFDDRGFNATRILECTWADRLTLAVELRGTVRNVGGQYTYIRPQQYPHRSGVRVSDVRIQPFATTKSSGDNKVLAYDKARLTVEYRRPTYGSGDSDDPIDAETLVTESLEPAAEFLTLPAEKLSWKDGETYTKIKESEAPGLLVRMMEWVYTRHKVTEIPVATFTLVGCVNDKDITSKTLGVTFAKGTLLYSPPQLEREITTEGAKAWCVTYRFMYRKAGWSKFPRAGKQMDELSWESMYDDAEQELVLYKDGDFSQIMA